ncbi:hypothetical protein I3843_15G139400 [Carya illinoinensis]|nr:hypothetical protein I3843_15G139400 [Carya illinoinensis]
MLRRCVVMSIGLIWFITISSAWSGTPRASNKRLMMTPYGRLSVVTDAGLVTDPLKYNKGQVNGLTTCQANQELCTSPTECALMCHRVYICCNKNVQHAKERQQLILAEGVRPIELCAVRASEDVEILVPLIVTNLSSNRIALGSIFFMTGHKLNRARR